ncbi:MAG TPA: FRG domain-containing protein [Candidatus Acidoferrum sp.]|nr:FRG domain-containing protein [Candidatus Acidoferrum sp.]
MIERPVRPRETRPLAESLPRYIELVSGIEKRWSPKEEPWGLWYRGHQKAFWHLQPRLYRNLEADEDAREADDDIREDFIRRAPSLTDRKPETPWEWYFLMQHYGAPTRLLDWTEGALIALYFAVSDNHGYHDAAVWVLDPWWLNGTTMGFREVIPPGSPGLSKKDTKKYAPWLPDRFGSRGLRPTLPIAIYPSYIDRRIVAQRSCFTIHGKTREGLDQMFGHNADHLSKITVPGYAVEDVKRELRIAGINDSTVFPDLGGLGRSISQGWEPIPNSDVPHANVYTTLAPSKIDAGGVGVFAIKKIKKGTPLFTGDNDEILWVKKSQLPRSPKSVRDLYRFAVIKNDRYGCPPTFNRLTPSWYLNHSEKPNVKCTDDYDFVALEDIEPNEELTIDYLTYNDQEATNFD